MSRPTLRDVAARAGVSTAAASLALRGLPGVSPSTRDTVLDAADTLGYVVNVSARNLRRRRTDTIGIYLPQGTTLQWYYADFAVGVSNAAGERGVAALILPQHGDPRPFLAHVDGIVTVDVRTTDPLARAVLGAGREVVTGERVPEGQPQPDGVVFVDHEREMTGLLRHLEQRGSTSIGVLLPPEDTAWGIEVARAARRFADDSAVEVHEVPVSFSPETEEIQAACATLPDSVDAIVAVPDGTATSVAGVLRSRGQRIPEDVRLASYTDAQSDRLLDPPVTAIDLRPSEFGARCAQLLLDLLEGADVPREQQLNVELRARAATN
ncbi:LacI family DNA-binding transcriptional regulator [Gulosibacter sediminis]|uniref:LacI family DNA-binding transcriptional regulator n=1 Tax=Gulosibacter sediminis TaxID=1729695 RepID=UPI0024A92A36|nr:LacI family DNA-binding transcriptional regulator [Gulosibacter sediminis]